MPAAPPPRLDLRRILADTGRIFARDFLALMAIAFILQGGALAGQAWLQAHIPGGRPTSAVIPWIASFIPFTLADGATVWVGLRRLADGRGPVVGGAKGLAMLVWAVVAINLVENLPDLIQTLVPPAWVKQAQPSYGLGLPIVEAIWLSFWFPALAVAIAERAGAATSLGRSLDLTFGHRGTIAALTLALQAGTIAIGLLFEAGRAAAGLGATPVWMIELASLPLWAFSSAAQAAAYCELQRLRTGLADPAAARAFD
jgi:hypothetical protein